MRHIILFIALPATSVTMAQTDTTYYRISQPDNGIVTLTTVEITAGREVTTPEFLTDEDLQRIVESIDREIENSDMLDSQYEMMRTQLAEEVIKNRRQKRYLQRKRERIMTRLSQMQ